MQGLWDHPHRPQWEPGGGGLCLHTVLVHPNDPDRLLIAISAAGVYLSDDGGGSWRASNGGIVVAFMPDTPELEFGQCVHKVARDAGDPERLYLQHHGGIYRSDDGGGYVDGDDGHRRHGLRVPGRRPPDPTGHRLPAAARERRVPLHARTVTAPCGGPTDAGDVVGAADQRACPSTTPTSPCCATRSPPTAQDPAGLYFGTRTGEVYGSIDDGESWRLLADHLPPVVSVRAAPVG